MKINSDFFVCAPLFVKRLPKRIGNNDNIRSPLKITG